jgi:hypothetical protein
VAYLTFTKGFEVEYSPGNVVAVEVNEDNVTVSVFSNKTLADVYRVETSLGRMVIAYAERRRRITKGYSTKKREVRKELRRLREREKKLDTLRKAERFIEKLAIENKAVVVIRIYIGRLRRRWRGIGVQSSDIEYTSGASQHWVSC